MLRLFASTQPVLGSADNYSGFTLQSIAVPMCLIMLVVPASNF